MVLRIIAEKRPEKMAMLGRNIFDVNEEKKEVQQTKTIKAIKRFFEACGLPVDIEAIGLNKNDLIRICDRFIERGQLSLGGMNDIEVKLLQNMLKGV